MQCDATAARRMIEKACLGWIERVTGLWLGIIGNIRGINKKVK
jgi:hypothetical protein